MITEHLVFPSKLNGIQLFLYILSTNNIVKCEIVKCRSPQSPELSFETNIQSKAHVGIFIDQFSPQFQGFNGMLHIGECF